MILFSDLADDPTDLRPLGRVISVYERVTSRCASSRSTRSPRIAISGPSCSARDRSRTSRSRQVTPGGASWWSSPPFPRRFALLSDSRRAAPGSERALHGARHLEAEGGVKLKLVARGALPRGRRRWHSRWRATSGSGRRRSATPTARAQFAGGDCILGGGRRSCPGSGPRAARIDDDLAFRALYIRASAARRRRRRARPLATLAAGGDLGTPEPRRRTPSPASAAANLLGVLFFTDPDDPENSPAERAVGAFQDATLCRSRERGAKANLELILRQLSTSQPKGRSSPGGGDKGGRGGAGLAPGGKGY